GHEAVALHHARAAGATARAAGIAGRRQRRAAALFAAGDCLAAAETAHRRRDDAFEVGAQPLLRGDAADGEENNDAEVLDRRDAADASRLAHAFHANTSLPKTRAVAKSAAARPWAARDVQFAWPIERRV